MLHLIVLDTYTTHVYLSFHIYYGFNCNTWRTIGGSHIGTYIADDDAKADSASPIRTGRLKVAVST